jgi:hypothetical protein
MHAWWRVRWNITTLKLLYGIPTEYLNISKSGGQKCNYFWIYLMCGFDSYEKIFHSTSYFGFGAAVAEISIFS